MKKICFVVALLGSSIAFAQPKPGPIAIVDFFKVAPGKGSAYEKLEKETWKPLHQARKKSGEILAWYCYQLGFTGASSEYNYVTVTVIQDLGKIDKMDFENLVKTVYPKKPVEEINKATLDARTHMKSEVFFRIASTFPQGSKPSPILTIDYKKVHEGSDEAYRKMIQNIFQPYLKELTDAKKIAGSSAWESWTTGTKQEYDFVIVNAFTNFASLNADDSSFPDSFKKVFPALDFGEVIKNVRSYRDQVKSELWHLVDYVD